MRRILVVDDNAANLYMLQTLLRGHGDLVDEASNGVEALARARQRPPDLVISDLLMPTMDGFTLLRQWKADPALARIPFVVYTATYTEPQDERLALDLGADAFLVKPTEPDVILARLEALFGAGREARPAPPPSARPEQDPLRGAYHDVVVRKLEKKVRELEGERIRLADALRVAEIGSWTTDLRTLEVAWSEMTHRIFETDSRTFQPSHAKFLAVVHPDERAMVERAFNDSLSRRELHSIEHRIVLPDGRIKHLEERWHVSLDEAGHPESVLGTVRDVTVQRRADSELRESEDQLRRTFAYAAVGIAICGLDGRVVECNAAYCQMLGFSQQELRGMQLAAVTHPDDRPQIDALLRELIDERRSSVVVEKRCITKDRRIVWSRVSIAIQRDRTGRATGLIHAAEDITQQIAASEALRASEERLRLLSRVTNEAIQDWDVASGELWWNEGFETQFGYRRDDRTRGHAFWRAHVHPDDAPAVIAALSAAMATEVSSWSGEYRFRRGDGTYVWVFDRSYITRDATGRAVRVISGLTDLTERRLAEAKLLEQAALLDKAQDAILVRDLEHRVTYWNKSAESLYGWRAAEVVGRSARDMIYLEPDQFDDAMRQLLAQGEFVGELAQRRRDGRRLTVEGRWTLVRDDAGQPRAVLAINTDISERKILEEQLRQSQKMEAVGQFAGGVAHDFNNLLTVIVGCSEHLAALRGLDAVARESVLAIRETSDRAADLTRKLLSFSRRSILQPKVLDLNAVVAGTAELLRRIIGDDVQLVTLLQPGIGRVKADPTQLDQVLMNLAANARDAMPDGGKLTVQTKAVVLDEEHTARHSGCRCGPHVLLSVADTGHGMGAEVLAHIFEPFYTTKESGKGTGLGLATVYGIVQQSGGCVHVHSEPGHGARFDIYLPVVDELSAEAATPAVPAEVGGNETILLVEDDEQVRRLVAQSLRKQGYTVLTATDGVNALEVLADDARIDLLLTDVMMPNLSGAELARRIGARFPAVKVLFMSGYTDDAVLRHGLLEERVAFIQKPYTPSQLARKVRAVLRGAGVD